MIDSIEEAPAPGSPYLLAKKALEYPSLITQPLASGTVTRMVLFVGSGPGGTCFSGMSAIPVLCPDLADNLNREGSKGIW